MEPAKRASLTPRSFLFVPLWIAALGLFFHPARAIYRLALANDSYTHLLCVPILAVGLIYLDRSRIFHARERGLAYGSLLAALSAACEAAWLAGPAVNDRLWLPTLSLVSLWIAIFIFLYGNNAARTALFPLAFLLFAVPIPSPLLNSIVLALQTASAGVTHALFKIVGVPVLRDHFRFSLPGVEIEVARECAGIRSTIAMVLCSAIAAHLFLDSAWKKIFFIALTIPVAILKNGIRIVSLSWLAIYVNRWFLEGPLHHNGGPLFALVGLAILLPALLALQRWDSHNHPAADKIE